MLRALYLLFNEGYHGSDADNPLQPALCADALRLCELLLESSATSHVEAHALSALFCFNAARLVRGSTRRRIRCEAFQAGSGLALGIAH